MIRQHPRLSSALAFGTVAAVVTHFAWVPDARWSGAVPALSVGCGLAHAIAGAAMGRDLIDPAGVATPARSYVRGAQISLLAQLIFVIPFSFWVSASGTTHQGLLTHVAFTAFVGFFAFLAVGWGLCVASAIVGASLYWLGRKLPEGGLR